MRKVTHHQVNLSLEALLARIRLERVCVARTRGPQILAALPIELMLIVLSTV